MANHNVMGQCPSNSIVGLDSARLSVTNDQPSGGGAPAAAATNIPITTDNRTNISTTTQSSTNIPATTQSSNPPQGNSQTTTGDTQNTNTATKKGLTYGEIGIITERPKRFEYATRASRLTTFEHWPTNHPLKKEDFADAGFYYAGKGDCVRCFYCAGGLRNWNDDDNVWVEHTRWSPKCAFIRQTMGQQFVDAVKDLDNDYVRIGHQMVTSSQLDTKNMRLKRDPAVVTVLDMGYNLTDVVQAANYVKEKYGMLSADKVFKKLKQDGKSRTNKDDPVDKNNLHTSSASNSGLTIDKLKKLNIHLRQQTVCKICMDKEVAVVFLPCGHFVSCIDCAAAMQDCPVCRKQVRGIVRAFIG